MAAPTWADSEELPAKEEPHELKHRVIWYADPEMKIMHSNLVKTGMERARSQGKRIGRPRVTERPDFDQRFASVVERLDAGILSRRRAARELGIGYATITRLLEARLPVTERNMPAQSIEKIYAEVLD